MHMSFIQSYLGAAVVFLMGILAVVFANTVAVAPSTPTAVSVPSSFASTTVSVEPIPVPDLSQSASSSAATGTARIVPSQPRVPTEQEKGSLAPAAASGTPTVAKNEPAPATTSSGNLSLDASSSMLRKSLVNIICYAPSGGKLHSISGSGVIIDPKGIILTNAHVAQYFLLADRNVTCTIRAGSPAVDTYKAALMYLSPEWIRNNPTVLTTPEPIGTGQYDFALLAITGSGTGTPLPQSFPSIPLGQRAPAADTPVVIASYGAQFLNPGQVQSSLYPTIVFGSIKDVFTFTSTTIDVLSLGGSAAAQEGSSGGGVADASGQLIGTITTSTVEGQTSARTLSAISASYIRGEYATETGSAIDMLLAEPTATAVAEFATQIPSLEAILAAQLN